MSWLEGFSLARLVEFNDNIKKILITLTFSPKKFSMTRNVT
jgi:hypothetical protein